MERFFRGVVGCRFLLVPVFSILAIVCLILKSYVGVDYNMNDYLPEDSASTIAIQIMQEEFPGGIPNEKVMIKDVTIPQALEYKEQIEAVDGVISVTWLDDSEDIAIPTDMMDRDVLTTYYKKQCALFSVTIEDGKYIDATDAIREIIGDNNCISGTAASTAIATKTTMTEVGKITGIAVLFVFLILIVATNSFMEPFIVLVSMGAAIAINAGSNLIFGTISFVTDAAGNVLLLAVSLDYAIFLIHAYREDKKHYEDRKEALAHSLATSLSSILSSGLTTVIGFLALVLMKFRIGPDLGLALAKGVAISLIIVFFYLPGLIILFDPLIEKLNHRKFMPSFDWLGKAVSKVLMYPMIILFFVILVPVYLGSNSNTFYYGSSDIFGMDTQLGQDTKEIEDTFGQSDTYVLMVSKGQRAIEAELSTMLHSIPEVTNIISYVDSVGDVIPESYLDEDTLALLESDNYTRFVISVSVPYEGDETWDVIDQINDDASILYDTYYLAGAGVSTYDLKNTIEEDMKTVNIIAILAVFVVLLITFRKIVLPVILVVTIEAAIWVNLTIPYFMDTTIYYIAYLIISSIQLGATVDYAILFTNHYLDNRKIVSSRAAIARTLAEIMPSILVSGSALCFVGFLMGIISTNQILSQLGTLLGRGGLLSLFMVIFVLPGLLFINDRRFYFRREIGECTEEK